MAAAVVTVPGSAISGHDLMSFLAARLPAEDLPDRVVLVNELPRDGLGKVIKRRLQDRLRSPREDLLGR
jgi:non-ribosomal peptide synthetase component E (peptide arylation enzyme)